MAKRTTRTGDSAKKKKKPGKDPFNKLIEGLRSIEQHGANLDSYAHVVQKHEKVVLERLLDVLRPIVRFLDGEIIIRENWMAGRLGAASAHYPEHGIVLVNNFSSQNDPNNQNVVNFTGYKVLLTRSGRLVKVSRTGVWQKSGGEDSFWSIESMEIPVSDEFARDHLQEVVQSIMNHVSEAKVRVAEHKGEMEARLNLIKDVRRLLEAATPALDETQRVEIGDEPVESEKS